MKKRMVCLLLIAVCLLQLLPATSAASVRNKKVVSVVYDDSNSMWQNNQLKWAYANYAMQAFAGMLNEEDALIINYMSSIYNGIKSPVVVNTNDRKNAVNSIRAHNDASGTPVDSIDVAFNNLKTKADSNPNTQYWIVVMTDGGFYRGDDLCQFSEVEAKLCSVADQRMPNGTLPKIIYFSMCDTTGEYTPASNLRGNIEVRKADEANSIVSEISEIADEVSGRYSVDKSEIKQVDEKTLKVTSKLPLVNIGVLSQFSNASVSKVAVDGKTDINVESNVPIQYPECSGRTTDKSLIGNVAIIGNGADNIPEGTYIITFSEAIKPENVEIMFEPAIELRLKLFSGGNEITDVSNIQVGAELEAEAALYEIGTDNLIDISLLPGGVTHSIKHLENGTEISSTDQLRLVNIKVGENDTRIVANFNLPGYFDLEARVDFTPKNITVTGLTSEISWDGSERKQYKDKTTGDIITDAENVVYISKLKENRTGVKFSVLVGGERIDKATAEGMLGKFKASITADITNISVEVCDDGSFLVYPSKKCCMNPGILYSYLYGGECTISVEMDGLSASGTLVLKDPNIWDIWPWIPIVLLIWSIFFKKRFYVKRKVFVTPGSLNEYGKVDWDESAERSKTLKLNLFTLLWPFGAQTEKINGVKFQACDRLFGRNPSINILNMKGACEGNRGTAFSDPYPKNKMLFTGDMHIRTKAGNYYHIFEE